MVEGRYNHKEVEKKWQRKWEEEKLFSSSGLAKIINKFYNLWMFPYPSAEGLHAGHAFASTGSDVYGRFMRMQGKTVFQPIGYDSFGIHSENYAIKIGDTPQNMLARTIKHYEEQLRSLGHGYDWTRTVTTSSINYYKWTQWLFLQMFKAGLAYRKKALVNWCPSCKTVLSDEQVMTPSQAGKEPKDAKGNLVEEKEGMLVCERCGTLVEKKELEQWFFRITEYADKLLANLGKIDWPDKIKIAQRNWIGKKEGITIKYQLLDIDEQRYIKCWTSRPDTNFGATFIVVSPEYAEKNLLNFIGKSRQKEVEEYIRKSLSRSKEERIAEGRKKTGIFTGLYALNKLNDYEMPVWVSDFVLYEVGTGAVVGVPGHDKRDFEFAKRFGLEIKRVVVGPDGNQGEIRKIDEVWEGDGKIVNSGFLTGINVDEAKEKIMDFLESKGWGERETNYHLRDWLISRQRYWGTPIPMIYCKNCAKERRSWFTDISKSKIRNSKLLHESQNDWDPSGWWPEENLPVELPKIEDYKPEGKGRGPLANHPEFYEINCPKCGYEAIRETDVMDTFVDSSWYFLRYPSVGSEKENDLAFDPDITKKMLPVDLYFGGAEHSVLHLMYARFVTMVLNDLGFLDFDEPFPKFFAHGLMIKDGAKMSKSRGNVVNPDEYIEKYGADTLRLYLMFMGPMDGYPDFRDTGIEGMRRFVERIWNLFTHFKDLRVVNKEDVEKIIIKMHQTIKKVTIDLQEFKYNTAIAAIMEYVNTLREVALKSKNSVGGSDLQKSKVRCAEWDNALRTLALLLNPFSPHLSEEVWRGLFKEKGTIQYEAWPKFDESFLKEKEITIPVQVNGKLRGSITISLEESENKDFVIKVAKENESVSKWIKEKEIKNIVFVPRRLINFVV